MALSFRRGPFPARQRAPGRSEPQARMVIALSSPSNEVKRYGDTVPDTASLSADMPLVDASVRAQ